MISSGKYRHDSSMIGMFLLLIHVEVHVLCSCVSTLSEFEDIIIGPF